MPEPKSDPPKDIKEAAAAPTATASKTKSPVDQNKDSDSIATLATPPFKDKEDDPTTSTSDEEGEVDQICVTQASNPAARADTDTGATTPVVSSNASLVQQGEWENVYEGETPFGKCGSGLREIITARAATDKIVKLPLDRLLPHPFNEKLFGANSPKEITDLAESIREVGQQSPLMVTANSERVGSYTLLSGHKRADALRLLNRKDADCQVVDVQDADERLIHLLEANRQHTPTTEQKVRIATVYLEIEAKKAKARQIAGAKATKKGVEVVEGLTQAPSQGVEKRSEEAGKARDHAAAKVGLSGVSFDKGRKVIKAIDKAQQDKDAETASELRRILNDKGIEPAYARADVLQLVQKARKNGAASSNAKGEDRNSQVNHQPQNASVGSTAPKEDAVVLASPGTDASAEPQTADQAGEQAPPLPSRNRLLSAVALSEDPTPGASVIALGMKFIEELEELDVAGLTADLRRNLNHTLDDVDNWRADHDEMLQVFGQS